MSLGARGSILAVAVLAAGMVLGPVAGVAGAAPAPKLAVPVHAEEPDASVTNVQTALSDMETDITNGNNSADEDEGRSREHPFRRRGGGVHRRLRQRPVRRAHPAPGRGVDR
jgi:hypothetical protein